MKENFSNFKNVYSELGIDTAKMGCVMLDVDGSSIVNHIAPEDLYVSNHPDRFWIKGFVAEKTPHVTLLYGLLQQGVEVKKSHVDEVLKNWSIPSIVIDHVDFFESPYEDDPYYCIVAKVEITKELLEANQRLSFLPHINTFADYTPHITIAYIRKDEDLRDAVISSYNIMLSSTVFPAVGINYGKLLK